MVVDQGGLDYTIKVRDQFTEPIRRFRQQILTARETIRNVSQETAGFTNAARALGDAGRSFRSLNQAARQQADTTRQLTRDELERARAIQRSAQAEQARERTAQRINRAAQRDQAAEVQRLTRIEAAQQRAAQVQARAQQRSAATAAQAARAQQRNFQQITNSILGTTGAGNRLIFTLRNIIGVAAGLLVFQRVTGAFADLLSSGIEFNRTLESGTTAVAGIITAIGNVRNAQGQLLEGQEKFNAALSVSAEIITTLRQQTLRTGIPLQGLISALEITTASGLAVGLSMQQVATVATNVAQAAAILNVPLNQLGEEIRSILNGTINPRNTRIATVLGLTNADVRRAGGNAEELFKLLQSRFANFQILSDKLSKTFSGSLLRARAILETVAGTAAAGFFNTLRDSVNEFSNSLISIDVNKNITPKPAAVATALAVFGGLRDAVLAIGDGLKQIDPTDLFRAAQLLGNVFRALGQILVGVAQGAIQGFGLLGRLVNRISASLGGFDGRALREVARIAGLVGSALLAASIAATVVGFAIRAILIPVRLLLTAIGAIRTSFVVLVAIGGALKVVFSGALTVVASLFKVIGLIPGGLLSWVGAIGLIFFGFQKIFSEILGFPVTIGDTARIIFLSFRAAFDQILASGKIGFKSLANAVVQIFTDPIGFLANAFGTLLSSLAGAAAAAQAVGIISEESRVNFEDAISRLEQLSQNRGKKGAFSLFSEEDLDKDKVSLQSIMDTTRAEFDKLAEEIAAKKDAGEFTPAPPPGAEQDVASKIKGVVDAVKQALADTLDGENIDFEAFLEKAKKALEGFSGEITGTTKSRFKDLFLSLSDSIQAQLDIARSAVTSFSSFVADSIVDAFDPTKDQTIQERFARFLQDIARLIITQLTQIAIAKAILGLGFSAGGSVGAASGGGSVPAFATGGDVMSPSHYGISAPPPPGVPASDTVPAWLTPGEYVHPVASVAKYGLQVMEAIRRGAIDPGALQALAGSRGASRRSTSIQRLGRALGGPVAGSPILKQAQGAGQDGQQAQPTPAYIVPSDQSVERLMAGGLGGFMRFFRAHAPQFASILRGAGRG